VPVESFGVIKSIVIPDSFRRGEILYGGMGRNWRRSFHPREKRDAEEVSITSFYRGGAAAGSDSQILRELLARAPRQIFSSMESDKHPCPPQTQYLLSKMADILGNIGNNQFTNSETGIGGPRFRMEHMETIILNSRAVLSVCGVFHNSQLQPQNYYWGIFVDARPEGKDCLIEELVFEAETKTLYEKYRPAFQKSLTSIHWL